MIETNNEIFGQYVVDYVLHADNPYLGADPYGQLGMRGDGNPAMHHDPGLFDQGAGSRDEATGETLQEARCPEDEIIALEGMRIATDKEWPGRTSTKPDAAELWLQENDPQHGIINP